MSKIMIQTITEMQNDANMIVGTRKHKLSTPHLREKMEQVKLKPRSRSEMRGHADKRKTMKGRYSDVMGRERVNETLQGQGEPTEARRKQMGEEVRTRGGRLEKL